MSNYTTLSIKPKTKKELEKLKIIPEEIWDNLFLRLIKNERDKKRDREH